MKVNSGNLSWVGEGNFFTEDGKHYQVQNGKAVEVTEEFANKEIAARTMELINKIVATAPNSRMAQKIVTDLEASIK